MEIRILMPRYGTINERRHRLHEVVRLSGMNIIVDDEDFPLIIKVASLPGARMQVYFLDNEEFFKRKFVFENSSGKFYKDNSDRMVFFCKGVVETVKKFGWPPDVIHCHGWMTSLVPLYLKQAYASEPLFKDSKIIYSVYDNSEEKKLGNEFISKAQINNLSPDDLTHFSNGTGITLDNGGIKHADAIVRGSETLESTLDDLIKNADKPVLDYQEEESLLGAYIDFYKELVDN
jgi:starch synthase